METKYIVKLSSGRTIEIFAEADDVTKFVESNMEANEEIVSIEEE